MDALGFCFLCGGRERVCVFKFQIDPTSKVVYGMSGMASTVDASPPSTKCPDICRRHHKSECSRRRKAMSSQVFRATDTTAFSRMRTQPPLFVLILRDLVYIRLLCYAVSFWG